MLRERCPRVSKKKRAKKMLRKVRTTVLGPDLLSDYERSHNSAFLIRQPVKLGLGSPEQHH